MKKKTNFWKKITNNWALKLFSLAAAFFLWLFVMTVENPEDQKVFYNIPVRLVNTELLEDENMVYEVLDETDVVPRVTITAKKSVRDELSSGDIIAEADFSNLTVTNTVEIRFYSQRYNDQISDIKGSAEILKLNIERKRTKRLELQANTVGDVAENYMIYAVSPDQNRIEISGPESVINRISSAVVTVDVTESSGTISTYSDVKLYDAEQKEIPKDNLTMNTRTVRVKVEILNVKTVPVIYEASGTPANGYLLTGEISSSADSVEIAGSKDALDSIHAITIPEDALDVTGYAENYFASVNIKDYLPDGVVLADKEDTGKVNVIVHIEKAYETDLRIAANQIHFLGVPVGYEAKLSSADGNYSIAVSGLRAEVELWEDEVLTGNVNIGELLEDAGGGELVPGTYELEVLMPIPEGIEVQEPLKVSVEIIKLEVTE